MKSNCPTCGYALEHQKHYRQCVDKTSWPAWMRGAEPMPSVTVLVATPTGSERVVLTPTAVLDAPVVTVGQPTPPMPRVQIVGGACCAHPEQVHIADAEGFPPTCMSCPETDGIDEHEWRPLETSGKPCECGYVAKTAQALAMHRRRSKTHQVVVG